MSESDRWLYAVLRELSELHARRHSVWRYLSVRLVEALGQLEQLHRPGWR